MTYISYIFLRILQDLEAMVEGHRSLIIVGGGPAGLTALKSAKEAGLDALLLDKSPAIGGIWSETGLAWAHMRQNLSHFTCMFSDYPWALHCELNGLPYLEADDACGDFKSREEFQQYLLGYCRHFSITDFIRSGAAVTSVCPIKDSPSARWSVSWTDVSTGTAQTMTSAFCVIASGVFGAANLPHMPALAGFTGTVLHSADVRDPSIFAGKHTIVIGGAFSGCELSVALTRAGGRVTHVSRTQSYIVPRFMENRPVDFAFYSRYKAAVRLHTPTPEMAVMTHKYLHKLTDQATLPEPLLVGEWDGVSPLEPPVKLPNTAISEEFPPLARSGEVRVLRGEVQRIDGNKVTVRTRTYVSDPACSSSECCKTDANVVEGEEFVDDVDMILLCTGYCPDLSFVDPEVLRCAGAGSAEDGTPVLDAFLPLLLHKTVFPALPESLFSSKPSAAVDSTDSSLPALAPVSIAFPGFFRGPFIPTLELQSRWAAYVFASVVPAPTADALRAGVEDARAIRDARPRPQFPYGNYLALSDDIAAQFGALPPYSTLAKNQPTGETGEQEEEDEGKSAGGDEWTIKKAIEEQMPSPAAYRLRGPFAKPELAVEEMKRVAQVHLRADK